MKNLFLRLRAIVRVLLQRLRAWIRFKVTGRRIYMGCDYGDKDPHFIPYEYNHRTGVTTILDDPRPLPIAWNWLEFPPRLNKLEALPVELDAQPTRQRLRQPRTAAAAIAAAVLHGRRVKPGVLRTWIRGRRWMCRRRWIHNGARQPSRLYGWYCPRCRQAGAEEYRRSMIQRRWILTGARAGKSERRRWWRYLILAAFLAIAAGAQAEPHNGAWWMEQAPEFKRAYLLGALDHAAPGMDPEHGVAAQWIGPDVGELVQRLDSFYALKDNRQAMVQESLPMMLAWLAAGPGASLQDAIRALDAERR